MRVIDDKDRKDHAGNCNGSQAGVLAHAIANSMRGDLSRDFERMYACGAIKYLRGDHQLIDLCACDAVALHFAAEVQPIERVVRRFEKGLD